jgi:mono/diheme cytochrome c family protein
MIRASDESGRSIMKPLMTVAIALFGFASAGVAAADDAGTVKVYTEQCAMCHGADGKGHSVMGKKLAVKDWGDGKTLNPISDADLEKMIRVGKGAMPGFTSLSDGQVKAMADYVRAFQK